MIVRLTAKLGKKIGVAPSRSFPPHPNPFADWSAHLFTAEHAQFILITNTASLYSMVMYGRGITDDRTFLKRMLSCMGEFLRGDGHEFIFQRFVVPETLRISFSKTLNRGVTGSMNDLVFHAKNYVTERELSPYEASFRLNMMPMGYLKYVDPRRAFTTLQTMREASNKLDPGDGV